MQTVKRHNLRSIILAKLVKLRCNRLNYSEWTTQRTIDYAKYLFEDGMSVGGSYSEAMNCALEFEDKVNRRKCFA